MAYPSIADCCLKFTVCIQFESPKESGERGVVEGECSVKAATEDFRKKLMLEANPAGDIAKRRMKTYLYLTASLLFNDITVRFAANPQSNSTRVKPTRLSETQKDSCFPNSFPVPDNQMEVEILVFCKLPALSSVASLCLSSQTEQVELQLNCANPTTNERPALA